MIAQNFDKRDMLKNWYVNFSDWNHHSNFAFEKLRLPIRPLKSLDYVCKTKWWYNKYRNQFDIVAQHIGLGYTLATSECNPTQTVDELTRWINHQPVNKSVSISSWIVAFLTLKWIWYFFSSSHETRYWPLFMAFFVLSLSA